MTCRGDRQAGFTLIETLVAVAVVAVVAVALQRGFVSTRAALARAEALTAAEETARDILENRLDDLARAAGVTRGAAAGLAWTVTSEPLALPFPEPAPVEPTPAATAQTQGAGDAPPSGPEQDGDAQADKPFQPARRWTPLRVTISVRPAFGAPLVVETVHLAPAS